jgi:nitrous oxidase accessory protein NosD
MLGFARPTLRPTPVAIDDVVIDRNENAHLDVGIELDASVADALIYDNTFRGVREPVRLANPRQALVVHSQ